jgi:electron transfer flavoprotein alpha subunit
VLTVNDDALEHPLAEAMSSVVEQVAKKYTHVLTPSTNHGKSFLPRAAAVLNSSPLMDVLAVIDESTFKRPMYAGNAIATVKMSNETKVSCTICSCYPRRPIITSAGFNIYSSC